MSSSSHFETSSHLSIGVRWNQKEGFGLSSPFQVNWPARLEIVPALEGPSCRFGYLDPIRQAICFKPACHVYGIAPNIIDELVVADNACDHRARVNADPNLKRPVLACAVQALQGVQHAEPELRHRVRVVEPRFRQPRCRHVCVAYGLDFLHPEPKGECIEYGEHPVEFIH